VVVWGCGLCGCVVVACGGRRGHVRGGAVRYSGVAVQAGGGPSTRPITTVDQTRAVTMPRSSLVSPPSPRPRERMSCAVPRQVDVPPLSRGNRDRGGKTDSGVLCVQCSPQAVTTRSESHNESKTLTPGRKARQNDFWSEKPRPCARHQRTLRSTRDSSRTQRTSKAPRAGEHTLPPPVGDGRVGLGL